MSYARYYSQSYSGQRPSTGLSGGMLAPGGTGSDAFPFPSGRAGDMNRQGAMNNARMEDGKRNVRQHPGFGHVGGWQQFPWLQPDNTMSQPISVGPGFPVQRGGSVGMPAVAGTGMQRLMLQNQMLPYYADPNLLGGYGAQRLLY